MDDDADDPGEPTHAVFPAFVFLYGGFDYVTTPNEEHLTNCADCDLGRLKNYIARGSFTLPRWDLNLRSNPNRIHMGPVRVKPINWENIQRAASNLLVFSANL